MKTVLLIAFHFPPYAASTGRMRTLSLVRHLPTLGWTPVVLTARQHAYDAVNEKTLAEIPATATVLRARGFDIKQRLSFKGRYVGWMATPDRWNSWCIGALYTGWKALKRYRPDLIWATFPLPSAVLAGYWLHKMTRLPLVLDCRDPMTYEDRAEGGHWRHRVLRYIERRAVHAASAITLTTPGACRLYQQRYPELPADKFRVIANGVEDSTLPPPIMHTTSNAPITLLHSGLIDLGYRDPSALLAAIARLVSQGEWPATARVMFRAPANTALLQNLIERHQVQTWVQIGGLIGHAEALTEMSAATGLLLLQGKPCNNQIPAKAYEYLACQRPILALCHADGDTHQLLTQNWQVPYVADMESTDAIATLLRRFLQDHQQGTLHVPAQELVAQHSRRARVQEMTALFDEVIRHA